MAQNDVICIIEPRETVKNALLQALRAEKIVSKVITYTSLQQALMELRSGQRADIVFVSHHFQQEDVLDFISTAKNIRTTMDSAFVLVMDQQKQTSMHVAKQVLKGADAFLSYPFNIETVQITVRIALGLKTQRLQARVAIASKMLLASAEEQLTFIAYDAKFRKSNLLLTNELKEVREIIHAFKTNEEQDVYFTVLMNLFSKSLPIQEFVECIPVSTRCSGFAPEADPIIQQLLSEDFKVRLNILMKLDDSHSDNSPYETYIRRCLEDAKPACRMHARSLLSKIESAQRTPQSAVTEAHEIHKTAG